MEQQCEIKAVIVLSNIHSDWFNESLRSVAVWKLRTFHLPHLMQAKFITVYVIKKN